jgi:hypothetical protein
VQGTPGHLVEIAGYAGANLSGPGYSTADDGSARQAGAGVSRPFRRECGVEQRADPPGVDLLGVIVVGHAFKCCADADSDDDDTVVGQQDVSWVEYKVVHVLGRCCGERVGDGRDDIPGLFGVKRRNRELLAEGGAGQPPSDDEDASVVLGRVDDAEQPRVLHSRRPLRGAPDGFAVWVPGVEEEHPNLAVENDVTAAPECAAASSCHLGVEVIAASETFHCHESTASGV